MAITFFDDQSNPQQEVDPTQTAIIKQFFKSYSQQLRVCLPATIVTYDYKLQQASVQPTFQSQYSDGSVANLPIIYNVPVQFPSSNGAYMHFPLAAGDNVVLHFSDKALDTWLQSGALQPPSDSRTHHIADAIAVPGCKPFNAPSPVANGEDLIVSINNLQFRMKPNGHIQLFTGINTPGTFEYFSLVSTFMRDVITDNMSGAASAWRKLRHFIES